jgi:hypothetical protein
LLQSKKQKRSNSENTMGGIVTAIENSATTKLTSSFEPAHEQLTGHHWLVLFSAFAGWMFDAADLNLFTLVLFPSVAELTGLTKGPEIAQIGGYIMAIKLFCWGIGGILFGVVADRWGRARTMILTILIYASFTGLSGLAQSWVQLAILQAIAGFGIGGEWAAGAALLAETWPEKQRARAMQVMQMAFAFGFFVAALDNLLLGSYSWRWVLAAGAIPAVLSLIIRRFVPEPERWIAVRKDEPHMTATATFAAIFKPEMRRRTIVGACGVIRHDRLLGRTNSAAELDPANGQIRRRNKRRSDHELCLHDYDGGRGAGLRNPDLDHGGVGTTLVVLRFQHRLVGQFALSVLVHQRSEFIALVHACVRLLCDRRFRYFCGLPAGAFSNTCSSNRPGLLLERCAFIDRDRTADRRLARR